MTKKIKFSQKNLQNRHLNPTIKKYLTEKQYKISTAIKFLKQICLVSQKQESDKNVSDYIIL